MITFQRNYKAAAEDGRKEDMSVKFTKGYVDVVIRMRADKEEAKQFLLMNLRDCRKKITPEHYREMKEYIQAQ